MKRMQFSLSAALGMMLLVGVMFALGRQFTLSGAQTAFEDLLVLAWLLSLIFEGSSPLLAPLMRLPNEPELWGHVMKWMLPAQILRGVLIARALYPFLSSLQSWSYTKRFLGIASLYIVIGQWCSPVAGASTIEGWVILRPEFTTPQVVLSVIPEGLIQGLGFGAWLARWLAPKSSPLRDR
jgi:hypothetical protein